MGSSMIYITVEWCQQSFLSTEDYENARQGLRMTRMYKYATFPLRKLSRTLSRFTFDPMGRFAVATGLIKYPQKTLLWTRTHTHDPDNTIPAQMDTPRPQNNPSIRLSDVSNTVVGDSSQYLHEYPAYETPAISQHTPRAHTKVSTNQHSPSPSLLHGIGHHTPSLSPLSPTYPAQRPSYDSTLSVAPLLQRTLEAHRQRELAGSATSMQSDEHDARSSGEEHELMSPVNVGRAGEYTPFLGMVQSRQRYTRATSDAGSPPGVDALGIQMGGVINGDVESGEVRRNN